MILRTRVSKEVLDKLHAFCVDRKWRREKVVATAIDAFIEAQRMFDGFDAAMIAELREQYPVQAETEPTEESPEVKDGE